VTRERAKELAPILKAFGDGAEVEYFCGDNWISITGPAWVGGDKYRIKPTSILRPMTRGEVLYMVTTTPGMVVRDPSRILGPASGCLYHGDISDYVYAIIDRHGNPIDGWHKFETDDEAQGGEVK